MPVLVGWIGEMLLSTVGQMAISAMVSLGIGFVGSSVISGVIDMTGIKSAFASAGDMTQYLGWFGIDRAITIVLSAWAGRKLTDAAAVHLANKRPSSAS